MLINLNHLQLIDLITFSVCGIIVIIFILGWMFRGRAHKKNQPVGPVTAFAPSAAISIGIFGTFLGIYLGLKDFDTSDINNSIPNLLEGLKTAFITSLFGMLFSIVLKYLYGIYEKKDFKKDSIASDEPAVLLRQISKNISFLSETINNLFRSEEEFSLVNQLKLIRADMSYLRIEVVKTLKEFSEKIAELGTEAMIKALREVIDQFNAHLNDLVGEEFKQLKEAMIELNEWQESYRESVNVMQSQLAQYLAQVELSVELLDKAVSSISKTSEHLDSIDGSLSTISVSAEDIQHHIEQLKLQSQQLAEFIDKIRMIGEEAKNVLPAIAQNINASTSELVKASEEAKNKLVAAGDALGETVEGISRKMDEFTKIHSDQVDKTINQIQTNLEEVLTKSLESLAGQLAALSNKFAEDYTPLTDQLREVVRIAERVNSART